MKTLLSLIVVGLASTVAFAQRAKHNHYKEAISEGHRLIDSLRQQQKIPGMDVAVSIDGVLVWSEAFGFADLEHRAPVQTGKTRFRIGSVSKPITATALGKLMDQGKLDINAPVQKYVPYFPLKNWPLTVKQVGGHLGGIRHYKGDEFLSKQFYSTVQSSLKIFQNDPLLFEPETQFNYSSYAFNLLSAVIEGASGENFLIYMQREVFKPLNMTSTWADVNDSVIVNRSSFYQVNERQEVANAPYVDNSYKWAGGGFISTTSDLIRFGEALMAPGFLSARSHRELTASQVLKNGELTNYGVGWASIKVGSLTGIGHSGGSVGGITMFNVYPSEKMVLVFLSNSSDVDYGNVVRKITQAFVIAKNSK